METKGIREVQYKWENYWIQVDKQFLNSLITKHVFVINFFFQWLDSP
jgi:hypothetical protein